MEVPDDLCEDFFKRFPDGFQDKYQAIEGMNYSKTTTLIYAKNITTGVEVVLKLFRQILEDHWKALSALRGVKYLAQLAHPNVVRLLNICGKKKLMFSDLFIEMEYSGLNLAEVLSESPVYFKENAILKSRCILHILSGLAYIHSAQIVHRNLTPEHVIIRPRESIFKITSFRHARKIGTEESENVTRTMVRGPFSAPEVVLYPERHTSAIDIYSVGLILIQVLRVTGEPFLKGHHGMLHIEDILKNTGKPREEDLVDLTAEQVHHILHKLSSDVPHRTWMEICPEFSIHATNLMERILHFSSSKRYTAVQALKHEFFNNCRNTDPERIPLQYEGPPLQDYPATISFPRLLQELNESITNDLSTEHDNNQLRPFDLH